MHVHGPNGTSNSRAFTLRRLNPAIHAVSCMHAVVGMRLLGPESLCSVVPYLALSVVNPGYGVLAANGSSATGACSDVIPHLDSLYTCATPTSSVLFDGVIPTLTALDGNTWARQLMIMQRARIGLSALHLYFDFTNTPGYTRVRQIEVVLFNCLQWGTAVREIRVSTL